MSVDVRTATERRDQLRAEVQSLVGQATALRAQIAADNKVLNDLRKTVRTYVTRRDSLERQVQDATNELASLRQEIDGVSPEAHRARMAGLWAERYPMGAVA